MRGLRVFGRRALTACAQQRRHSTMAPLRELSGSRGAQQWLQALEKAPCLVCGAPPTAGHRVDCAVSGLPLTCSSECSHMAEAERSEQLQVFKQIHEDLVYATSADARALLTTVVTREHRAQRRGEGKSVANAETWEEFTRQFTEDARWLESAQGVRLVSAAYSFVATLSHYLPALSDGCVPHTTNLHVVGARAEAMMPRHIWEELLDANGTADFQIKLIGDHVAPLFRNKAINAKPSRLQFEYFTGFYHEVIQTSASLSAPPDAFVLFNPGIGHPKLRESWRPTIEAILRSGKPALLTSFSQRDQDRDLSALNALKGVSDVQFLLPPQGNAFRSRCYHLDPSDVFVPIQSNSYAMIVRGRATP